MTTPKNLPDRDDYGVSADLTATINATLPLLPCPRSEVRVLVGKTARFDGDYLASVQDTDVLIYREGCRECPDYWFYEANDGTVYGGAVIDMQDGNMIADDGGGGRWDIYTGEELQW